MGALKKHIKSVLRVVLFTCLLTNIAWTQNVFTVTKTTDFDPFLYTPTTTDPTVVGTLQWALRKANDATGTSTINFNIPGTAPQTIQLSYELPWMESTVTIDGTSQPANGYGGSEPKVKISFAGSNVSAFIFGWGSENSVVKGLQLIGGSKGIDINNTDNITIKDNVILTGSNLAINIDGSGCIVQGNYIGTDMAEQQQVSLVEGIQIGFITNIYYHDNIIGGSQAGQGNVIYSRHFAIDMGPNCVRNLISRNKMISTIGEFANAIQLSSGANINYSSPQITSVTNTSVSGTSGANAVVEIFSSDASGTGTSAYLGTVTANGSGNWTLSGLSPLAVGQLLVATATDASNNTSALSTPSAYNPSCFVLNGGYLTMTGGSSSAPFYFVVEQPCPNGITRTTDGGGHIFTDGQYNFIKWNVGANAGNFIFPFGEKAVPSNYIPFTFNKSGTSQCYVTASTWPTNHQNVTLPGVSNVSAVTNMNAIGNPSAFAIDRFWDIRTSAATTADITFSYLGSENTTSRSGGIFRSRRWSGVWEPLEGYGGGYGVDTGVGKAIMFNQTSFSPFVLATSSTSSAPLANAGANVSVCSGSSVMIGGNPSASFGTAPYLYSWSPSATLNNSSIANPLATPTATTTYTLVITDSQGLKNKSSVTVSLLSSPTVSAGASQTICPGSTATLGGSPTATGGTTPYKYFWSPKDSLNFDTISNPIAKPSVTTPYTVTVIDGNNCLVTSQVIVNIKPAIYPFAGNDTTILKRDSISLGGNPTAKYGVSPFTYSWSPSTALSSTTKANPKASPSTTTSYIVTISDASGCSNKKDTVIVTVDPYPRVNAGPDVRICKKDTATLGASPTVAGGKLPYTFSWSPSTALSSSTVANPKASPTVTTTYILTVTDALAYVRKDTVKVTVNPLPVADAGNDVTISSGTISLGGTPTASGGVAPYKYSWSANKPVVLDNFANPFATLLETTKFFVVVTDSNNCSVKDSILVSFDNIYGSSCNCDSCTWTISSATASSYTINSGQKMCIRPGGIITGTITLNSGGKICNSGTFNPASFVYNGGTLINNTTGTVTISNAITLSSTAKLISDGSLVTSGNITASSGSLFQNYGDIVTQGRMVVGTNSFYNYGVVTFGTKSLVINSGALVNNSGAFRGVDSLRNSGTLKLGDSALVFTNNYFNYASAVTQELNTSGVMWGGIMVCARSENYGTISDSIDICDKTPSAGPVYLDLNSGTVASTVSFCRTKFMVKYSPEGCGACPSLAINNSGCAGEKIVFSAKSTRQFDRYDFYLNNSIVHSGADSVYVLPAPAVAGEKYWVIGTSFFSPCKTVNSGTITIQASPTVTISGNTIADQSNVTLTAGGASTYKWFNATGDSIGAGSTLSVLPPSTTLYTAKGFNSNGCFGTTTFELLKKLTISYSVSNPTATNPLSGNINVLISGGKYPLTYLWNTGSSESVLTGVGTGLYHVTVTDAGGQVVQTDINVAGKTDWLNADSVSITSNSIARAAVVDGWGRSGTSSANILGANQNGWAEFRVGNTSDSYMFGFGAANNHGVYTSINYAVNVEAGVLKIYESGTLKGSYGAVATGDIIRVERSGSNILYKKNGTQIASSGTNAALSLVVNTALNTAGSEIVGIQGLFSDYVSANKFTSGITQGIPGPGGGLVALCDGDVNRKYIHTVNYDENGAIIAEGKVYLDLLGRQIQTQSRMISDNNVIATQTIYDAQGRMILSTLPAPINQSYLCYKDNFITNSSGTNYSTGDFNVANYSTFPSGFALGEVDRPKAVGNSVPDGLGWYYSKNNLNEPYVPASGFPYTRVEYDDANRGDLRRTTLAGEYLNMGSGHESKSYSMASLNELDYLYGQNKSWILDNYSDANFDGQGTITAVTLPSTYRVTKTISVDENGQEMVVFSDLSGKALASCLSGQVNGANVNTKQVSKSVTGVWFMDVHLPKGCESSLVLTNPLADTYNILDLKTGKYVKFGSSINFSGTNPNLQPGFYRLIFKYGILSGRDGFVPTIAVTQNINYYNFSLNYYDKAGRLKLVVPPAGVDNAYTLSSNPPGHKMITSTDYNSLGWQILSITPDEGKTEYLYRTDGQVRFSQNSRQRASSSIVAKRKFSFINYDDVARPVETGEYDPLAPGIGSSPSSFSQNEVASVLEVSGRILQTSTTYDLAQTNPASYVQQFLLGKVSKTYNNDSETWYSYDELGRVSATVQYVFISSLGQYKQATVNYKYDFNGNVTEVDYQKESSAEDFYHYYEYDADKRLKRVYTSTDGVNKQEQALYFYYKHGPLKRVELANKLQGLDYVYTINGWLKSVNAPELNQRDPGKDGISNGAGHSPKDMFGMTLDYFAGDYMRPGTNIQTYDTPEKYGMIGGNPVVEKAKDLFNGLIKDQRWQTQIPQAAINDASLIYKNSQLFYGYLYDAKYQLTNAQFGPVTNSGTLNGSTSGITYSYRGPRFTAVDDYKIFNLSYDLNGNIRTLSRNGYLHTGGLYLSMDQLSYNYNEVSSRLINNKLKNAVDAVSGTPYTSLEFAPGQVSTSNNYVYDESGQQIQDNNSTSPAYTEYDVYGKVTAVYADAAKTTLRAKFTYDDRGYRLCKADASTETYYLRDASGNVLSIYQTVSNALVQKEIPLYGDKRMGIYDVTAGKYNYELSDHLGNVRTTFSTQTSAAVSTNFDGTQPDDYLFTYNSNTDNSTYHSSPVSVKVNAVQPYGTGIFNMAVKAGQVISGNFWYKTSAASDPDAMMVFSLANGSNTSVLNWTAFPVTGSTSWTQLAANLSYTVPADGLLSIYPWNNDATQTVWFDDLSFSFSTGGIVKTDQQSLTDYYPHGSIMPGRNYAGSSNYRFGYQGQFAEKDPETNKNSFELRDYDALLGRWMTIDPMGQYHSPYLSMDNDPINSIDPRGGSTYDWIKRPDGTSYWDSNIHSQNEFDLAYTIDGSTHGYMYQGKELLYGFDGEQFFHGYGDGSKNFSFELPPVVISVEALHEGFDGWVGLTDPTNWIGGIIQAGFEASVASSIAGEGSGLFSRGVTFAEYKALQGGTETLAHIQTSTGVQRISTEFHHMFITQRMQRTLGLPNWMVNNRINVFKLNTIQHSLIDSYRFNFLKVGIKQDVGWFGKYNWFTKF